MVYPPSVPSPAASLPERLPLDIIARIASHLDLADLNSLSLTSHTLSRFVLFHLNPFQRVHIREDDLLSKRLYEGEKPRHIRGGLEGVASVVNSLVIDLGASGLYLGQHLLQLEYVLPLFATLSEIKLTVTTLSPTLGVPKEVWDGLGSIASLRSLTLEHNGSDQGSWGRYYSQNCLANQLRSLKILRRLAINLSLRCAREYAEFQPEICMPCSRDGPLLPELEYFETDCPWLFGQIYHECKALKDVAPSGWARGVLTYGLQRRIVEAVSDKKLCTFDFFLPSFYLALVELREIAPFLSNIKELIIRAPPYYLDGALPEIRYPVGYKPGIAQLKLYIAALSSLKLLTRLVLCVDICMFYGAYWWNAVDSHRDIVHMLRKIFVKRIGEQCHLLDVVCFHGNIGYTHPSQTLKDDMAVDYILAHNKRTGDGGRILELVGVTTGLGMDPSQQVVDNDYGKDYRSYDSYPEAKRHWEEIFGAPPLDVIKNTKPGVLVPYELGSYDDDEFDTTGDSSEVFTDPEMLDLHDELQDEVTALFEEDKMMGFAEYVKDVATKRKIVHQIFARASSA